MRNALVGFILLVLTSLVFAQQKPRSHEQCLKQVPGDWGPNFGEKWHENEALYWACRSGVAVETIKAWQAAAEEQDMATEIKPVTVDGQKFVLFVEDSGTANCYGVSVLRQQGKVWQKVWDLPTRKGDQEGYYCAGKCPGLDAQMTGKILTIRSASTPDPNDEECKRVHWATESFRWNGATFLPVN